MTQSRFRQIGLAAVIVSVLGALAGVLSLTGDVAPSQAQGEDDTELLELVASLTQTEGGALSGPWELSLPRDYGAHPEAGAETWNMVAHLRDEDGQALSVNMILTRLGAQDSSGEGQPFGPGPIHVAQVIVTSENADLRGADARASRMAGTAGHDPDMREVWVDDWVLGYGDAGIDFDLRLQNRALRLSFEPIKDPLAPEADIERTIRGFAVPRLAVSGTVATGTQENRLTGTAWIDRLWGDIPLPGGPLVRDRFVLQLTDGTDLSLLLTRRRDGRGIATIDGVRVAVDGHVLALDDESVRVTPVFARQDDAIPTAWRIVGGSLDLEASLQDVMRPEGFGSTGVVGLLAVTGTLDGGAVEGGGTVLLSSEGVS